MAGVLLTLQLFAVLSREGLVRVVLVAVVFEARVSYVLSVVATAALLLVQRLLDPGHDGLVQLSLSVCALRQLSEDIVVLLNSLRAFI